jgi:hypothetical protein
VAAQLNPLAAPKKFTGKSLAGKFACTTRLNFPEDLAEPVNNGPLRAVDCG